MVNLIERIETPIGVVDELGREICIPCYAVEADSYEEAKAVALEAYQNELEEKKRVEAVSAMMSNILAELLGGVM